MTTTELELVRLDQLVEDPDNPRVDVGDVSALAVSIKNLGLQQALRVRKLDDGTYAVAAGSRRHAAMREANLPSDYMVPCTVTTENGAGSTLTGLVENTQREGLTVWEQADAFARLATEFGMKQRQISDLTGFDPSLVSRRIAVSKLSEEARAALGRVEDNVGAFDKGLDPDDVVKVARECAQVPDEVWTTITRRTDLNRLREAQQFVNDKEVLVKAAANTLRRKDPIVAKAGELSELVPDTHVIEWHRDRGDGDPKAVDLRGSDHGVAFQYHTWTPFSLERRPDPAEDNDEPESPAVDDKARDTERIRQAQELWYSQWWSVLQTHNLAKSKAFLVAYLMNSVGTHRVTQPFTRLSTWKTVEAYTNVTEAEFEDHKLRHQLYIFGLVIAQTQDHLITGKPSDAATLFENDAELAQLQVELKVKVPRVKR